MDSFVNTDHDTSDAVSTMEVAQPLKEVFLENSPPRAASQQMDYSTGISRKSTESPTHDENEISELHC